MRKKRLSSVFVLSLLLISCFQSVQLRAGEKEKVSGNNERPLDIVLCLDLSGSTNGLINDLRDNLWLIVNQAEHMNPKPDLRIGVIGFSRPSFGKENAYVKILAPLTSNFDYIAAELYKLKPSIEKGDQIVSEAIRTALNDMKWSNKADAVKLIYLIGNGMVTANGYEYVRYCEQARDRNIPVHALYVMKSNNWFKELPAWRRIAGLTNGMQTELTVNKPDDLPVWKSVKTDLKMLNDRYNATYLWSGVDSSTCRRSLTAADSGAFYATPDAFLNRIYYKSGDDYRTNFGDCDIVSNNALADAELGGEASDAYKNRMKELYQVREQLRLQMKKEFPGSDLNDIEQAYIKGEVPDNNILHRCILNILYRAWGMR